MTIAFACPNCESDYEVKESLAGRSAPCRKCGWQMTVPVVAEHAPPEEDDRREREDEPVLPPRRRRRNEPRRKSSPAGLVMAGSILWGIAGVLTVGIGLLWFLMMQKAQSAVQEASGSAMAAAVLIGLYIVARATDKILLAVRELRFGSRSRS